MAEPRIEILCSLSQEIIAILIELEPAAASIEAVGTADGVYNCRCADLASQKTVQLLFEGQTQNIQKTAVTKVKVLGLVLTFPCRFLVNQGETQNPLFLDPAPKDESPYFAKIGGNPSCKRVKESFEPKFSPQEPRTLVAMLGGKKASVPVLYLDDYTDFKRQFPINQQISYLLQCRQKASNPSTSSV